MLYLSHCLHGYSCYCFTHSLQSQYVLTHQDNLNKITYPTDNQGRLCGYDLKNYPYVYYTSFTDPVDIF